MVDPNRKINRLTEKDIEFLDECEKEFANRFTKDDEEFIAYCSQPLPDPPVVPNWSEQKNNYRDDQWRRGGGGGGRWNRNQHRPNTYRGRQRP